MRDWRRLEKVSWTERKTNEEVLEMIEEERSLIVITIHRHRARSCTMHFNTFKSWASTPPPETFPPYLRQFVRL